MNIGTDTNTPSASNADLDFNVPIQKTGFFICPWCEMKNRKKEKECEANGETCRSERPCESGNAVHNG